MRSAAVALMLALACALSLPLTAHADSEEALTLDNSAVEAGLAAHEYALKDPDVSKSETIYSMLKSDGTLRETYVVNRFITDKPTTAEDFGPYTQVTNLSTTQELSCEKDKVTFDLGLDPFFYQGYLEEVQLPWNVSFKYELDGKEISPEDLAGASGQLVITVETCANPQVNKVFYDCFMMQITFALDGGLCADIQAEGATFAESGKDQTVAFTVLPGHDGSFKLSTQVTDFEMPSVQIAALAYSSVVEMPDTSDMESGLSSLSYAVSQLNAGTFALADGAAQLSSGANSLADGANQFGDGLAQVASSGPQLVSASAQINGVLAQIADALSGVDLSELDGVAQYSPVLREMASTLATLKNTVNDIDDSYERMAQALDYLATVIRDNPVTDAEIAALKAAAGDDETALYTIDKLVQVYRATQSAINDYYANGGSPATIQADLEAVFSDGGKLDQAVEALYAAADFIDGGGVEQLKQLVVGLQELSVGYSQFHAGLVAYTQGVQTLSDNYSGIASGVSQLAEGTSQLSSGADQLAGGVSQLNGATSDLPTQMRERMGEMMADYDFPAFDPVSFVDERNEHVTAVQFVMLTDAIEKPKAEAAETEPGPEPSILDRFMALFS